MYYGYILIGHIPIDKQIYMYMIFCCYNAVMTLHVYIFIAFLYENFCQVDFLREPLWGQNFGALKILTDIGCSEWWWFNQYRTVSLIFWFGQRADSSFGVFFHWHLFFRYWLLIHKLIWLNFLKDKWMGLFCSLRLPSCVKIHVVLKF